VVCSLEASGTQAGGVDWLSLTHKEIERSIAGIASQGNGKRLESRLVNRGFIGLVQEVGRRTSCLLWTIGCAQQEVSPTVVSVLLLEVVLG
jgi:hypothetical protein